MSLREPVSAPFAATAVRRFRRLRADCRTLAIHLAEARAHIRCCERARLTSTLASSSSGSGGEALISGSSLSASFRRFLRQRTMPIIKRMRETASDSERARIMPVMASLSECFPQPLGREGEGAGGEVDRVESIPSEVETWSSWTGKSVAEESMHCVIYLGCHTRGARERLWWETHCARRRTIELPRIHLPPAAVRRLLVLVSDVVCAASALLARTWMAIGGDVGGGRGVGRGGGWIAEVPGRRGGVWRWGL